MAVSLLDEDLHDGSAHRHPHAVLLEHVQKRQEALLGTGSDIIRKGHFQYLKKTL